MKSLNMHKQDLERQTPVACVGRGFSLPRQNAEELNPLDNREIGGIYVGSSDHRELAKTETLDSTVIAKDMFNRSQE